MKTSTSNNKENQFHANMIRISFALLMTLFGTGLLFSSDNDKVKTNQSVTTTILNNMTKTADRFGYENRNNESRYNDDFSRYSPTDRNRDPVRHRDPTDRFPRDEDIKQEPSEEDKIRGKVAYRYSSPVTARFLRATSPQTALKFYRESMQLIDARHLKPTSYQTRVNRAIQNLKLAVELPSFRQANGLNYTNSSARRFQADIDRFASSRTVRSANDAITMMYGVANIGKRSINLPATTVAMELVYGAVESLGKYSTFIPSEPTVRPSASLEDHVVGIGVEIKTDEDGILVIKPIRNGPAEKAGLKPGDIITSISNRPLAGKSLDYAVDLIKGQVGTTITMAVSRNGNRPVTIRMTRARVRVFSVSDVKMIDTRNGVGYIKLDKFAEASDAEMDQALWKLYREGMQSLVFDLRGNPGGLLTTAISLSNKFIPEGGIVSTKGRNSSDNSNESATYAKTWKIPLVVLVDGNSASASEIFAAAIQDNKRGLIVGRKSYGKGTVQTHFPLRSVRGNLKLTTALFYSPSGRKMAGAGVTPDVRVQEVRKGQFVRLEDDRDVEMALRIANSRELEQMASRIRRSR